MSSAMINRNVFTQVDQDSGSLTFATTVVHRLTEPGEYKGVLLNSRGEAIVEFAIRVGEGKSQEHREQQGQGETEQIKSEKESGPFPAKVEVNLTNLSAPAAGAASGSVSEARGCCEDEESGDFKVVSGGYAVFRVTPGAAGGYAVELYKEAESGRGEKVFDSRALGKNDTLAVVLLRPGAYSITNTRNGAKAELKVAYPEKIPRLLEPVKVTCTSDTITPAAISVYPMQGIVFSFETPSRVSIQLVTPEDRAARPRAPPSRARDSRAKRPSRRLQLIPRNLRT